MSEVVAVVEGYASAAAAVTARHFAAFGENRAVVDDGPARETDGTARTAAAGVAVGACAAVGRYGGSRVDGDGAIAVGLERDGSAAGSAAHIVAATAAGTTVEMGEALGTVHETVGRAVALLAFGSVAGSAAVVVEDPLLAFAGTEAIA